MTTMAPPCVVTHEGQVLWVTISTMWLAERPMVTEALCARELDIRKAIESALLSVKTK